MDAKKQTQKIPRKRGDKHPLTVRPNTLIACQAPGDSDHVPANFSASWSFPLLPNLSTVSATSLFGPVFALSWRPRSTYPTTKALASRFQLYALGICLFVFRAEYNHLLCCSVLRIPRVLLSRSSYLATTSFRLKLSFRSPTQAIYMLSSSLCFLRLSTGHPSYLIVHCLAFYDHVPTLSLHSLPNPQALRPTSNRFSTFPFGPM
ncbi:hypothetical protein AG1IA_07880 [Rhizoctonia solani AG-1 IA]|uniref:Uncharacterized protein n=1 Tax=Thanatephorus cucumeris (strain AG1-IA) TaxID=983506 RepID=L8WMT5_THACA|nr:hypothetical protein AG1IA_07880 [Rhizoctonia solani AG-1 IA]